VSPFRVGPTDRSRFRRRILTATIAFGVLAASCRSGEARRDTTSVAAVPAGTRPESFVVTPYGIGPLKAGMTIAEARAAVPSLQLPPNAEKADCDYAKSRDLPDSVLVMIGDGRVARLDVLGGSIKTAEGAGIGDTEERIQKLYGNRLTIAPHKYTDGHYLIVRATDPRDSAFAIVFETDGRKVINYRAGRSPAVHYVEGCS
jgi:hypothetical protein